jgi:biopolymer transport protein TolR
MAENNDAPLSAAQRSRIRRLSQPVEPGPGEEAGELNIVPFLDIITNVLMFVLATVSVTFTSSFDTSPPKRGGGSARAPTAPSLNLTVTIVPDGFSVKARGGNVAPGCNDLGPGLAVSKATSSSSGQFDYNYAQLTECVKKLKHLSDDFKDEVQVALTANPEIPYQVVVRTTDAVRRTEDGEELFPEVLFGVAK